MDESECLCVQGLAGQQFEAVLDELAVFGIYGAFPYFRTVVSFIVEKRMPDIIEMHPYLMCPPGFEPSFDYCHVSESFKDLVVGHCMLAVFPVRKYLESHPV